LPDSRLIGGLVFYRRVQGKETGMGSLIEELRRREDAARAEADRLRIRIERAFRGCMAVMSQCDHVDVWRYHLSGAWLCLHGLHERSQALPE
jgi:hypothetical protein